jgi:hypothetical protein
VYVHNSAGKVIEEIHFGLEKKYRPLRKKIHRTYNLEREAYWLEEGEGPMRDQLDRSWDLEQIFREAILSWNEETRPPAYFKNALKWGILNMGLVYKDRLSFRERFEEKAVIKEGPIECKQCEVSFLFSGATGGGECPFCESPIDPLDLHKLGQKKIHTLREDQDFEGGSLDETVKLKFAGDKEESEVKKIDLLPEGGQDLDSRSEVLQLIDHFEHPVDKALLLDFYDSWCRNRRPTSNAEMSRLLREQKGIEMTPRHIGRHRKKLTSTLQEFFPSNP